MLPVAAVLAGALVITAVIDLVERRIPLVGEAAHLPEVVERRVGLAARRAHRVDYSIVTVVLPDTDSNSPTRTRIGRSHVPAKRRSTVAW